ncbi:GGDEF domain-containing protein [Vogesella oryzae]|uniref:GGDEF domain-containing protein n=1 Tax=Vogesella oryzae TaxID=1735285 RepID=UPI001582F1F8|nr:GGDEF domain-containing protein [Vogesella oryzae]
MSNHTPTAVQPEKPANSTGALGLPAAGVLPASFLDDKFRDRSRYSQRMWQLSALMASGMWVWDYVIDAAGAQHTLLLRLVMGLLAMGVAWSIAHPRMSLRHASLVIFATAFMLDVIFFDILKQLHDGFFYGIGGYMYFQMAGFLVLQGLSFPLIMAAHILFSLGPHLQALLNPQLEFPHLLYAVQIWPATGLAIAAQYALYREYIHSYQLLRQLSELASHDSLTGAMTRRAFRDGATTLIDDTRQQRQGVAILMMDADFFKRINDEYGHTTGDAVLRQIAAIMQDALRRNDLFCRWGGEEFVALLQSMDESDALEVAERIRLRVQQTEVQLPEGGSFRITVSIGVATAPDANAELEQLIIAADTALYRAKFNGRNRVCLAEAGSNHAAASASH